MKGAIEANHIAVNKYRLIVIGIAAQPTITEISGIEDELQTVELPDRTNASGGNRGPTEFTIKVPLHHQLEIAAMEIWYKEGQDPVSPGYKKDGSLVMQRIGPGIPKTFTLLGMFVSKRVLPDGEMANEGEMAEAEYTIKVDDIKPV